MITEAIVLAGGLGTRLKATVPGIPKSLAPVAGKPFLAYLLDHARKEGITKFIFALGYGSEQIEIFVKEFLPEGTYIFSLEQEPLGTGGAIYKACMKVASQDIVVLNADTFFGISFSNLAIIHELGKAACTMALKPMKAFDRYGAVEIYKQVISRFNEKKYYAEGLINGGTYALSSRRFLQKSFPAVFSFERDYLEKEYDGMQILGMISDAYFIDIGVPEDYYRAQTELLEAIALNQADHNLGN
jgi:D-glycero-alpha-D-manno-heptose 1-phosphate guanylyltransferase